MMLKYLRTLFLCAAFLTICAAPIIAQKDDDNSPDANRNSYEVVVQLLISDPETAKLPNNLATVEKKLKTNFPNLNFRSMVTMLHRTAENSSMEAKSVTSLGQPNQVNSLTPTFLEFSLKGIRPKKNDARAIEIRNGLRFGSRIPVVTAIAPKDEKGIVPINYEYIGITAGNLTLTLDEPTIIGTLSTSRPNEILVLVVTVKPDTVKQ